MVEVRTDSHPFGLLHGCERRQCSDWARILSSSPGSGNVFLLSNTPGPIQPLVRWLPRGGGGFLWLKRPVRELNHLPSSVLRVRL